MNNDDIVDVLNDLIECSKDGEYGFRTSSEYLRAVDTRALFERRAEECRLGATELPVLVVKCGGKAQDGGTATGAMHRGWVAVNGTLAGYSDKAILEETERGEDSALDSYRSALEIGLPPEVRTAVEKQYECVKRNHAQIRSLRDQARAAAAIH